MGDLWTMAGGIAIAVGPFLVAIFSYRWGHYNGFRDGWHQAHDDNAPGLDVKIRPVNEKEQWDAAIRSFDYVPPDEHPSSPGG